MPSHIQAAQPSATPLSRHISELNKQYVHAKPIAINTTATLPLQTIIPNTKAPPASMSLPPLPPQTTAPIPRHFQAVGITPVTYSLLPSTTDSRKVCQNPITESFIKGISPKSWHIKNLWFVKTNKKISRFLVYQKSKMTNSVSWVLQIKTSDDDKTDDCALFTGLVLNPPLVS